MNLPKNNEIHLWHVCDLDVDALVADKLAVKYLDQDEFDWYQSIAIIKEKNKFLLSRVMIKSVLCEYDPSGQPQNWKISKNKHGKPYLSNPSDRLLGIQFNISYSKELIILGVSVCLSIGIDCELVTNITLQLSAFHAVLTDSELTYIHSHDLPIQIHLAINIWTMKEAVTKALGLGLRVPFDQICTIKRHMEYDNLPNPAIKHGVDVIQFRGLKGHAVSIAILNQADFGCYIVQARSVRVNYSNLS